MFIFKLFFIGKFISLTVSQASSQHPCNKEVYTLNSCVYNSIDEKQKKLENYNESENIDENDFFLVKILIVYLIVGASNFLFWTLLGASLNNSFVWDKLGGIFSGLFLILALINMLWWVSYSIKLVVSNSKHTL